MNENRKVYEDAIRPYITGEAESCSYCDHLDPLILIEGVHTYVTLAIGQIVEGYVQICTQKHRTAATGLFEPESIELAGMKKIVRAAYREVYGNPGVAFENGKAGSCLWKEKTEHNMKDLCHHTHIHYLPVEIDIRKRIEETLPEVIIVHSLRELAEVRRDELESRPYLYFEDGSETGYVYPVDDMKIPRQFLRKCAAEELGVPERADWLTYPGVELFEKGKEKLQPVLTRLHDESKNGRK